MKKGLMMIALAGIASTAFAQFGGVSKPSIPGGGDGATPAQIDKFLSDAVLADILVQKSSLQLLRAVVSKEEADKIEAQLKAAMAIQDPKEKEAKVTRAREDIAGALARVNWEKEAEKVKAEHNAKKNKAIKGSLWNLALGSLKDVDLANSGKNLVSGTPRPESASKIQAAKEAIEKLVSQSQGVGKILGSAKTLMSVVGLESLPKSSSESPIVAANEE